MSNKKTIFNTQVLQVIDALLVCVSFLLAPLLWSLCLVHIANWTGLFRISTTDIPPYISTLTAMFIAVPFIPLAMEMLGFYKNYGQQTKARLITRLIQGHIVVIVGYSVLSLILNLNVHRPTLILSYLICGILLLLRELYFKSRNEKRLKSGRGQMTVILVGKISETEKWWGNQEESLTDRFNVVENYDLSVKDVHGLKDELNNNVIERVIFIVNTLPFEKVTLAIEECEIQGVDVWLAADFVRARICQPSFDMMGNAPMLVLSSTPSLSWSLLIKEIMDKVGALLLIIVTSPLWIFAFIGIKLKSPGPVFYQQERAGKYGNSFKIWKFRTMDVDADQKLDQLKEESGNEMSGPVFKLENDPRVFKFGALMRRTSIDELPQLINVLIGEMSLVGPRPMAMYELPFIERSEHRRKLSVKPGITCIWQVEGRNTITDFDEWVALDLKYIDNWSLFLDIKILLQTLPAVLFSRGAS